MTSFSPLVRPACSAKYLNSSDLFSSRQRNPCQSPSSSLSAWTWRRISLPLFFLVADWRLLGMHSSHSISTLLAYCNCASMYGMKQRDAYSESEVAELLGLTISTTAGPSIMITSICSGAWSCGWEWGARQSTTSGFLKDGGFHSWIVMVGMPDSRAEEIFQIAFSDLPWNIQPWKKCTVTLYKWQLLLSLRKCFRWWSTEQGQFVFLYRLW